MEQKPTADLIDCRGPEISDPQRDVFNILDENFPTARHVKVIVFKERAQGEMWVIGNHYHHGWERFRIVRGSIARTILANIDSGEHLVDMENLGPGTVITVPPRTAHALLPTPNLVLVIATENGFKESDLAHYPLMDEEGSDVIFE